MENKDVFSRNLRKLMEQQGKSRRDISDALGISYFTVSDWVCGKKYPRMDKVELLANYFRCDNADLLEDKKEPAISDGLSDDQRELISLISDLPPEQVSGLLALLKGIRE